MLSRVVIPPVMLRTPVLKDVIYVGKFGGSGKAIINQMSWDLDKLNTATLRKYPYLGIGIYLTVAKIVEPLESTSTIIINNYKTQEEREDLRKLYRNAGFHRFNKELWLPIAREFAGKVLLKSVTESMRRFSTMRICGSILLEMPDRSGIKIWFEGDVGNTGHSVVFYHTLQQPWVAADFLSLEPSPPLMDMFGAGLADGFDTTDGPGNPDLQKELNHFAVRGNEAQSDGPSRR